MRGSKKPTLIKNALLICGEEIGRGWKSRRGEREEGESEWERAREGEGLTG